MTSHAEQPNGSPLLFPFRVVSVKLVFGQDLNLHVVLPHIIVAL